ncbi:hypothetical protein GPX89_34420 [Nocardia sp. ET3-3]|uniref:Uncharacterized protein n=1 Tax=Nocardia terrae TaxID=2675851 RepID=A0A7K1V8B0_9NOCA|nr:hypothetical protein [Nocardia terrae]MVU82318.1 hypothetical protein [Nocardia terrae]
MKTELMIDPRKPIPAASDHQAQLEAMVLRQLADRRLRSPHPFGIARVRLLADNTPIIHLDSHGWAFEKKYSSRLTVSETVLPHAQLDVEEVYGAIGLRVTAADERDMIVQLLGTNAKVILRTKERTAWTEYLRIRREKLFHEHGCIPLWEEPSLTAHERRHLDRHGRHPAETDMAWLGSALLRRIAVLRTFGNAYSFRLWTNFEDWVIETSTRRDVPLNHSELMAWFTDPRWGAELRLQSEHCECRADSLFDTCCRFNLAHKGGEPGGLQMRFHHERHSDTIDYRQELEAVGTEAKWLDRVLPLEAGADGIETPALKELRRRYFARQ